MVTAEIVTAATWLKTALIWTEHTVSRDDTPTLNLESGRNAFGIAYFRMPRPWRAERRRVSYSWRIRLAAPSPVPQDPTNLRLFPHLLIQSAICFVSFLQPHEARVSTGLEMDDLYERNS